MTAIERFAALPRFRLENEQAMRAARSSRSQSQSQPSRLGATPQRVITPERTRFDRFLETIEYPAERLDVKQVLKVREIWQRATSIIPALRPPTAILTDEGRYVLSWNFDDLRGVTLEVTVHRDGLVEWFFRDLATNLLEGSDDAESELSAEALTHLRAFRR